jgi:hypothetical protein
MKHRQGKNKKMTFNSRKKNIQRVCASPVFLRLMFTLAILAGDSLWATAMMIRYIKAV